MSFELPDLDTVSAAQLLNELVLRIPRVAPKWTEQNSSDPGITLLEMLVWIVEATAYQANCIPFESYLSKVRLILGLAFSGEETRPYTQPSIDGLDPGYKQLQQRLSAAERDGQADFHQLRDAVFDFRSKPYLASTQSDIETLAMEANGYIEFIEPASHARVLKAHADYAGGMVRLALLIGDSSSDFVQYDSHVEKDEVSLTATARATVPPQGDGQVGLVLAAVDYVRRYVSPRSLLGNPIAIREAACRFADVRCTVRCAPRADSTQVAEGIAQAIVDWMQPYTPKVRASSMIYGIAPTKAALLSVLANISGISAVEGLDIEEIPPPERNDGNTSENTGVGPQQIRHFKGHRIDAGGATILRSVQVTARAFSS